MTYKEDVKNSVITLVSVILFRYDFFRKYLAVLYIAYILCCFITELADIYILLNRSKFDNVKNRYLTKKITNLNNAMVDIKRDKIDYVFNTGIGYLFLSIILLIFEGSLYNNAPNIIIKIVTLMLIAVSAYQVLSIFIYNEIAELYNSIKFIFKNVEKNLVKKAEILYIINTAKFIFVFTIFIVIFIKMLIINL